MDIEVRQQHLSRALQNVSRVTSSKTGLPILANILLRVDGSRLNLAATNLEMAVTYSIGAKITKKGSITIPARLASEFVSSLPDDTIHLKSENNTLTITSGGYISKINGMSDEEFPELPGIDEKNALRLEISVEELKQATSQTIITASNDATRPVLTGAFWHTVDGSIYLAATDGYRLSEKKLSVSPGGDIAAIVPITTLQEVLRNISDDLETIEVLIDETQIRFRVGDGEITSRLIDGNFPDYRQLIPNSSETTVTVKKNELQRVAKIAGLFARDIGGSITINVDSDKGTLQIHSIASEVGENTSEIECDIKGNGGSISLNSRYLLDALSVCDGDIVSFGFSGKLAPCVVSSSNDKNYTHIIMPIKS